MTITHLQFTAVACGAGRPAERACDPNGALSQAGTIRPGARDIRAVIRYAG